MSKKRGGKSSDKTSKKGSTGMPATSHIQITTTDSLKKPSSKSTTKTAATSFAVGQIVDIQQESRGKWKRGKIVSIRPIAPTTSRKKQPHVLYDVSYDGGQMELEIDADRIRCRKQPDANPFSLRPPATADILEFTKIAEARQLSKPRSPAGAIPANDEGVHLTTADPSNLLTKRHNFGEYDNDQVATGDVFKSEDQVLEHQAQIQRILDDLFSIHADVHSVKKALSALLKVLRLAPQVTADYFHFKAGETILLHIIRSHQLYSVLQCYGFVLLRKMCHLSVDSCAIFVQNGAIPAIATALRAFPSDPIVQASGCGALSALGQLSVQAIQAMLEHNVVPLVVASLVHHQDINNHTRQVQFYASEVLLALCDNSGAPVAAAIVDPIDDYTAVRTLVLVMRKSLKLDDKKVSCSICTLLLCLLSLSKSIAQVLRQADAIADLSIAMAKYPTHEGILKYSLPATRELAVASMQQSPSTKVRQTARIILEEEPLKRSKPASPASARKKPKTVTPSTKPWSSTVLPSPSHASSKKESSVATREKLLLQTYGMDPSRSSATNPARSSKSRQSTSPSRKNQLDKQFDLFLATSSGDPMPELPRPLTCSKLLPLATPDPPAVRPVTMATTQSAKIDRLDVPVPASPLAELKSFATELFEGVNDPMTPLNRVSFADKLHRMIEKAETSLDSIYLAPPATAPEAMPPPARFESPPGIDTKTPSVNLQNGIFTPLSQKLHLTVGTKVKCRFNGGIRYYAGVISRCNESNQTFDVDYVDGEQECDVPLEFIRVMDAVAPQQAPPSPAAFANGDVVEARYKGKAKYFPGVILRVGAANQSFDIAYDDGEIELDVARNLIKLVGRNEPQDKEGTGWRVGQKVEARYKQRQKYYKGKIARARSNGTYDIEYDDGEKEIGVAKDMIRVLVELEERPQFEEGDLVQAQYEGNARFYNGTIVRCRLDGSYDIKYDDGDVETFVASERIRKRSPPPFQYAVGTRVEIVKGSRCLVGTITKVSARTGHYSVLYDHGDKEKVAPDNIRGIIHEETFERHQRIEARPPTSQVYSLGLITKCRFNGTYDIEFESGEVATGVAPSLIRSLPWPPKETEYSPLWHVGDIVEAKYEGKLKYFPGVVARVEVQGPSSAVYEVHFESGSVEPRIPEDSIHLLHRSMPGIPVFASGEVVLKHGKLAKVCRCYMDGTYDLTYPNGLKEVRVAKADIAKAPKDTAENFAAEPMGSAKDNDERVPSWFDAPCKHNETIAAALVAAASSSGERSTTADASSRQSEIKSHGPQEDECGQVNDGTTQWRQTDREATGVAREHAKYDKVEVANTVEDAVESRTADAVAGEAAVASTSNDDTIEAEPIENQQSDGIYPQDSTHHGKESREKAMNDQATAIASVCSSAVCEPATFHRDSKTVFFENHVTEPSDDISIERDEPEKGSHDKPETKHDANDEARIHLEDAAEANLAPTSLVDANPLDFSADEKPCHVAATLPGEDPFARALVILSVAESTVDTVVQAAVQVVQAKSVVSQRQHVLFALELKVAKATGTVPTDVAEQSADVTSHEVDPGVLEHVDARVSSNNSVEVATPPSDTEVLAVATEATVDVENVGGADESTMRHSNLQLVKSLSSSTAANLVKNSIRTGVQQAASRKDLTAISPTEPKEANLAVARDTSDDTVDILVQANANMQDLVVDDTTLSAICVPALKVVPEHFVSKLVPTPMHSSVAAQVVNKAIQDALQAAVASSHKVPKHVQEQTIVPTPRDSLSSTPTPQRDDVYIVPQPSHEVVPPLRVSSIRPLSLMASTIELAAQVVDTAVANALAAHASLPYLTSGIYPALSIRNEVQPEPADSSESFPSAPKHLTAQEVDITAIAAASNLVDTGPQDALCTEVHDEIASNTPFGNDGDITNDDDISDDISLEVAMIAKSIVMLCLYDGILHVANRVVADKTAEEQPLDEEPATVRNDGVIDGQLHACVAAPSESSPAIQLDGASFDSASPITVAETRPTPSCHHDNVKPLATADDPTVVDSASGDANENASCTQEIHSSKFDLICPVPATSNQTSQEAIATVNRILFTVVERLVNESEVLAEPTLSKPRPHVDNHNPACDQLAGFQTDKTKGGADNQITSASKNAHEEPFAYSMIAEEYDVPTNRLDSIIPSANNRNDSRQIGDNEQELQIDNSSTHTSHGNQGNQDLNEAKADQRHHSYQRPDNFTPESTNDVESYANDVDEFADKETAPEPAATAEEAQPSPAEDDGAAYGQDEEFEQTEAPDDSAGAGTAAPPTADSATVAEVVTSIGEALLDQSPSEAAAASELPAAATTAGADAVEAYANDVDEFADKETAPEPAATAEEAQPSPAEDDGAAYGQDEEFEQTEAPDDSAGAGTAAPPTADSATVAEVVTSIGEALLDQSPSEAAAASELPAAATTAGADAVEAYANDVDEFADKETAPEPAATAEEAQPSPAEDDGAAYGQDEEFEQTEAPDDSAGAGTAAPPTADSATVAEVVTSIGEALLDQSPSEAAAASELPAAATTAGADAVEAYANDVDEFADKETAPEPAATAEEAQPSPAEDDALVRARQHPLRQTQRRWRRS
ncbi:hypothetical protein H310_03241 [Aphanomyces invadans]|uniref:Tudor domain-containing protein n=1 Tax=Aphanomyces invadans TaxID=157072 RepID=A0A024UIR1_9STRA|nr:hypothetical protein H310_03241 [Aphanomyces invadans]ETW05478.1 hypothetical protein H310_03241 [Aphanomyces invadans]|eukprot:XP_008865255.1 hypothetical protein H310_03241 [Aphanomyces invadans]